MIPQLIKDGDAFVEGRGYSGKVEELTLPSLTVKTEDIQAGGMIAPLSVDMGLEKLEASLKLYEWSEDIISRFATTNNKGVKFRFVFAAERDDVSEELTPIDVAVHGRIVSLDFSAFKKGSMVPLEVKIDVAYFRYESDGKALIEIDVTNMIYNVNGVDRYAQRRAALGRN